MRFVIACFRRPVRIKVFKYIIFIISCIFLILLCNRQTSKNKQSVRKIFYIDSINYESNPNFHAHIVDYYFDKRMNWTTSNLGTILFKNIAINTMSVTHVQENKTYNVLIWKHWNWLKNRLIYSFSSKREVDPLQECSVKNCKFTGDDTTISSADAVIIHVQKAVFPNATLRNPKQRWVFLSDESTVHSFSMADNSPNLADLSNMFNWSMTYRSDSDVPIPYGRTIPLEKPILNQITDNSLALLVPYWNEKRTDVLVSILISHCGVPRRTVYLQELQEHLKVDIYGKCSKDKKTSCPGHYKSDCKVISEYLFYLVFENSECDEYLTEKLFHNAYSNGAIPVILGPTVDRCELLLPPESFLHVDKYINPEELAKHIIEISQNSSQLLAYHRWRNDFYVTNEHGYFGTKSYHLCRICEALNYNDHEEKYYDEESLRIFFDPTLSCR